MKNLPLIAAITFAFALIVSAWILGNAFKYKFKTNQTINVTGNAKKDFEADIVKWQASFSRKNFDLKQASGELNTDRESVRQYLVSKGIKAEEIRFEAVNIYKDYSYGTDAYGNSTQTFSGYNLTQNITVESADLDKVDDISREISTLISQGIELSSNPPNYYYSKLEDLKLELISQASENARLRAENIAKETKSGLGELVKADLGIFQITGQNDNEEYSYGGVFNTRSRKKTANITVKTSFRSN